MTTVTVGTQSTWRSAFVYWPFSCLLLLLLIAFHIVLQGRYGMLITIKYRTFFTIVTILQRDSNPTLRNHFHHLHPLLLHPMHDQC